MTNENLKLEGNTNDSFYASEKGDIKTIRLMHVEDDLSNYSFEITSESAEGKHPLIDLLTGKKISIEIKIIE